NCTLRQRLGRLVRETFSFSKTDYMHLVVLSLFIHSYNRSKLST
ncbi:MAG TPA: IS1 family transposase, partial [Abditibacterium sp.]